MAVDRGAWGSQSAAGLGMNVLADSGTELSLLEWLEQSGDLLLGHADTVLDMTISLRETENATSID